MNITTTVALKGGDAVRRGDVREGKNDDVFGSRGPLGGSMKTTQCLALTKKRGP